MDPRPAPLPTAMPANVVAQWRFNENGTEESLTLYEDHTCLWFYEDDMGDINQLGTWRDDAGNAVVKCKEEVDGRYPIDAKSIKTPRGSVLPRGQRPDVTAAWEIIKDEAQHQLVESLTLLQDATCVYRYRSVKLGSGGEDYRKMGTWMLAKKADGSMLFKVEGIPEAAMVSELAGSTLSSSRGHTLLRIQ